MNKDFLISVGAGILSGVMGISLLGNLPAGMLMTYFAPLPLFLIGLSQGINMMMIPVIIGLITSAVLGGFFASGLFSLINALPAVMAVRFVLQHCSFNSNETDETSIAWYPVGHALAWLSVLMGTILIIVTLFYSLIAGDGLSVAIRTMIETVFNTVLTNTSNSVLQKNLIAFIITWFPGLLGSSWIIMTVVNGALAQGILVRSGKNIRPSPDFAMLTLPSQMSLILVGAAIISLVGSGELGYMGRNLVVILFVPFFFLGLAVILALIRYLSLSGYLLAALIIATMVFSWLGMILAIIGFIEHTVGLRKRMIGNSVDDREIK